MKVILLQDIQNTGKQGDVITVSDGYARNYLYPRKLAVEAQGGALKNLLAKNALEERRSEKILTQAQKDQAALEGKVVNIHARSGEGKLYGRVTAQDIADAIGKDLGVKLDKRKISLLDPIKQLGEYQIPVKLHRDVTVDVKVTVVAA
ncbi:MAG: 50S ribosomal protein L9 [Capsulimonadaceae bacterium]|nr:50S ribosomal protein L9 [Capsulimonadaceae bacterium]